MYYELEIASDSEVAIRKVRELEQWGSELHFNELNQLLKYLNDYLSLECSHYVIGDLLNSAPMDTWISFT